MRTLLVWLLSSGIAAAQVTLTRIPEGVVDPSQPPPRDARTVQPTGTGMIRGRVITGDTGVPIRRASVTLSGPASRPRTTNTDEDGRYAFTALPSGTYTISASPGQHRAAYQSLAYGSTGQLSFPKRIDLADAQTLDNIDIALPRAGVITGRVMDASGEPAANVSVSALVIRGGEPQQMGPGATTDDLGQYRLFGLQPGTYVLRATSRFGPTSGPASMPDTDMQGFAPTYAPGTPSAGDAQRLRVAAGTETVADIRLIETRLFAVSGHVVSANGEPPRNVNVMIAQPEGGPVGSSFGSSVGPNGTFSFRNVPPGSYEVVARADADRRGPPSRAMGPPTVTEMGSVRVEVSGNLENVVVAMTRGQSVTGEIVFDEAAPATFRADLFFQPSGRRSFAPVPRPSVSGTTFTASGLFGPVLVRGSVSGQGSWFLKSVLLDGKDITDVPTAFASAHNGRLQVVFASAVQTIDGVVSDDAGAPTRAASVVAFPVDEDEWVAGSSRLRTTGIPRDDGRFTLRGLREGRYLVAAVPPGLVFFRPDAVDRELLASLKKVATEVVLTRGDTRTLDLRVARIE